MPHGQRQCLMAKNKPHGHNRKQAARLMDSIQFCSNAYGSLCNCNLSIDVSISSYDAINTNKLSAKQKNKPHGYLILIQYHS